MRTEVHKFGGTSVGSAERILASASLAHAAAQTCRLVVVSSAMSGVTDQLVAAARAAEQGRATDALAAVEAIRARHHAALDAIIGGARHPLPHATAARHDVDRLVDELRDLLEAVVLLTELSPRSRDRLLASGEKLAIRLFACALERHGAAARAVDADTFLETDGQFGEAEPLAGVADRTTTAALVPLLDEGIVPVVTGFCGRAPDGATTTLGRGGSDLSATVLAASLAADEVTIWTDVDGVFSADPRAVPDARTVPHLNYREAAELSYYGAKVLHQRTMIPVASRQIPVRTRNSMNPEHPGTVVDGRFTPGSHPVKAISAIRGQSLLSLEGKGMAGVPGVAARLFTALAERGISVTMISQSSSESSICLAVPTPQADAAESALKRAFRQDLSTGAVEEIAVRHDVGLVAAVGLGMAHHPGIAARVFDAIAKARVNVLAIAQGSSELNISLAVDSRDVGSALRAVHGQFGLHRLDTGVDSARGMDLLLLGCGNVGRRLLELVRERRGHVRERFDAELRIVGVADRSGYVLAPGGLDEAALDAVLAAKAAGQPLAALEGGRSTEAPSELIEAAREWRLARPVLVDCTASDEVFPAWMAALDAGFDVVTANKIPLAGPLESTRALQEAAARNGRLLRAEATVGAGLPIVDTLEMLLATGDRLERAEGCLSGTLGFVMTALEAGERLSDVVRAAHAAGYTEPDPVADLCGADVARKATILARWSGLAPDTPVELEGLVDAGLGGLPIETLIAHLRDLDAPLAARVAALRERGEVLRYVATVERDRIRVGPVAVPADSPLGRLTGTDNTLVFTSMRYQARPLVVTGPGAGVDVTAMGVLGDLLRIAAERRSA